MNNFSDIIYLDPNQIQVSREDRQRSEINLSDILDSIRENGVINPIIIKEEWSVIDLPDSDMDDELNLRYLLVAGERRLEACKQLNIQAPCRLFSNLYPLDAQIIEFEENHKRKNLPWRDETLAIGKIYDLSKTQNLTNSQIAQSLSLEEQKLSQIVHVYKHINEKILTYAENLTQAISLLHRFKSEKAAKLEDNLKKILNTKPLPEYLKPKTPGIKLNFETDESPPAHVAKSPIAPSPPILNTSFLDWIKTYQGPRFSFIHLDFPQSEENFWPIFNCFIENRKKLLDNQAHILLWFQMEKYFHIRLSLDTYFGPENIIPESLIWFKSDTKPNQIFGDPPKSTYETCLVLNHNNRQFKKQIQNAFHTPRASQPICPNQKSQPMLKYFFQTFIDSETNVFDPTCGSGSALLAAEELSAKSILGLEINQERFEKANEKITRAREIRKILDK